MLENPKVIIAFLTGLVAGGLSVWIGCGHETILVPKDTDLVHVSRFGGGAREIFVSDLDARIQGVETAEQWDEWERKHDNIPSKTEPKAAAPAPAPLSAEEMAQVKFHLRMSGGDSSIYFLYEIFNGTSKRLTSAEVVFEGVQDSGVPIRRVVDLKFRNARLEPQQDDTGDGSIEIDLSDNAFKTVGFKLVSITGY